jgi:hypothetical protein
MHHSSHFRLFTIHRARIFMKLPSLLLTIFALLNIPYASADTSSLVEGLPMAGQSITEGQMSVFTLTDAQRTFIACARAHAGDKTKTPYVFRLTRQQAARLEDESGQKPSRFVVYKHYDDYDDIGPRWNVAVLFSETEIEIPHKLLISDEQAEEAEFKQQGWAPNPEIENICGSDNETVTKPARKKTRH